MEPDQLDMLLYAHSVAVKELNSEKLWRYLHPENELTNEIYADKMYQVHKAKEEIISYFSGYAGDILQEEGG